MQPKKGIPKRAAQKEPFFGGTFWDALFGNLISYAQQCIYKNTTKTHKIFTKQYTKKLA